MALCFCIEKPSVKTESVIIEIRNATDKYLGREILKCFSLLIVKTNPCSHNMSLYLLVCNYRLVGMLAARRGLSALPHMARFLSSLTQRLHFYYLFGQE